MKTDAYTECRGVGHISCNDRLPTARGQAKGAVTRRLTILKYTGGGDAVYRLPGVSLPTPDQVFPSMGSSFDHLDPSSEYLTASSSDLEPSSSDLELSSSYLTNSSLGSNLQRDKHGYLLSEQLPLPVIDDLSALSSEVKARLEAAAQEPRNKKKIGHDALEQVLLDVCTGHYLTLQCLAALVNRRPVSLRNEYLSPMVRERKLSLAFPTTPTHERQAYCATHSIPTRAENDE
jgi:ATP-dependent DNA helicase RecG